MSGAKGPLFICSSLAAGQDGVGDYARRLAEACGKLGAPCGLLALHDREASQVEEAPEMPLLRLPASLPWPERERRAAAFIERVAPDWLSLQFVPYGFADRGIVWPLGPRLRRLGAARPWHVMFHELWIGAETGAAWRARAIGAVQRRSVLRAVEHLAPRAVTATNDAYVALLQRRGIAATPLPLFGNIPVAPAPQSEDERWMDGALRLPANRWLFVFFGTLHPQWQPEPLFTHLRAAAARASKRPVLVSIGRLGPGEPLWQKLGRAYGAEFDFARLGEQSAGRIAALLRRADFGVAASPWALIGKSGTAQSMAEHGLPVLVSRDDVRYPEAAAAPAAGREFIKVEADLPERLPHLQRRPAHSRLEEIARRFLAHLGQS